MRVDIGLDWDTATKKMESGQTGDTSRKCNEPGLEAEQIQTGGRLQYVVGASFSAHLRMREEGESRSAGLSPVIFSPTHPTFHYFSHYFATGDFYFSSNGKIGMDETGEAFPK